MVYKRSKLSEKSKKSFESFENDNREADKAFIKISKELRAFEANPKADCSILKSLISTHKTSSLYIEKLKGNFSISSENLKEMESSLKNGIREIDEILEGEKDTLDVFEKRKLFLRKAKILALNGKKKEALEVYEKALEVSASNSNKAAVIFEILKMSIYLSDYTIYSTNLTTLKDLERKGIDWEKKNTLKVYEAVFRMKEGNLESAAELCLKCISTFATEDVFSFTELGFYSVLLSIASIDRKRLENKIVNCPEITSVIDETETLREFLDSVYDCKYETFFSCLNKLEEKFKNDRFLGEHFEAFKFKTKKVVYSQFLRSYLSVTIDSVSSSFGVSSEFINEEFFEYISKQELDAKIDKVNGIVYRGSKDCRNDFFNQIVSKGDGVVHKVQRLSNLLEA